MRFTLLNLILANAFIAVMLGVWLDNEDKIRNNAAQLQRELNFIAASQAWHQMPLDQAGPRPLDDGLLFRKSGR